MALVEVGFMTSVRNSRTVRNKIIHINNIKNEFKVKIIEIVEIGPRFYARQVHYSLSLNSLRKPAYIKVRHHTACTYYK